MGTIKKDNSKKNNKRRTYKSHTSRPMSRKDSMSNKDNKTVNNNGGLPGAATSYDSIASNDINWYNKAGFLFNEATRVPFDTITGAPRSYADSVAGYDPRSYAIESDSTTPVNITAASVPGIMVIDYIPTVGWSDGVNSPINRAFTTLYGDIASKTTGALQFQQADLALLVTSLSSISSIIGNLKRYLEIATLYSPMNYYYPVDMLTALTGSEAEALQIIKNRDILRAQINDLVYQFNALRIPHFVELYKRQYALSHNVYADEDSVQAQVYMFRSQGYYEYSDLDAKLKWVNHAGYTFNELVSAAQNALNAWRNSSSLPLITGALIRAYPDNEFVTLEMLTLDSKIYPVYDRNITWQVNNMRTVDVDTGSLDITQDVANNFLISSPLGLIDTDLRKQTFWRSWVYLNSYDHDESPEFIMEATRLIPCIMPEAYDETHFALDNATTELPTQFHLFHRLIRNGVSTLQKETLTTNLYANVGGIHAAATLSAWKNGPRVDMWSSKVGDKYTFLGTFGDLADVTHLYNGQLVSLNEAALQSLYWVGSMNLRV